MRTAGRINATAALLATRSIRFNLLQDAEDPIHLAMYINEK
jgi:hypothetical protein